MRIDPQSPRQTSFPEQEQVASSSTQNTSSSTQTTTSTTQQVFSTAHISSTNAPSAPEQSSDVPRVKEARKELSIYSKVVFSKPFQKTYEAARAAIRNPANQEFMAKTGNYLPETKRAVDNLLALVSTKSAKTAASSAARTAFADGLLTKDEANEWMQLVNEMPESYKKEFGQLTKWIKIETQELYDVLRTEPGFARFVDKPEGRKFIDELKNVLNKKGEEKLPSDRGMALVFRFDSAYGAIAHVALASLWRDEGGKLCMGIAHQESVPPSDPQRDVVRGVVYDKFDTSSTYPGGYAPVVESMKLAGLPSVNVFPCPHPEAIVQAVQELSGEEKANPYGATDNWMDNNRGLLPPERPFETCFNVTHKVLARLFGAVATQAPLLPNILIAMRPFVSIPPDQFNTVTISDGVNKKQIDIIEIAKQPVSDRVNTFTTVGEIWGLSGTWDVHAQSRTSKHKIMFTPNQVGIPLPQGVRSIKFLTKPAMLILGGKQVHAGIAYTKEETEAMIYMGKEKKELRFVASAPIEEVIFVAPVLSSAKL